MSYTEKECQRTTTEPCRGIIELSLSGGGDRDIIILCSEDVTLYQLGAYFRAFALAMGYSSDAVDDLISPEVEVQAVEDCVESPLCVNGRGCDFPLDCEYSGHCESSYRARENACGSGSATADPTAKPYNPSRY